jgi:protein gp37
MGDKSKISWTDATWGIFLGCSKVSPGCEKCYAVRDVHRMAGNPNPKIGPLFEGLTAYHDNGKLDWTGEVRFVEERLLLPLRWQKPRRIFVNSMSDTFHPHLDIQDIDRFWAVMLLCYFYQRGHVFQVLTKRPHLMARYVNDPSTPARVLKCAEAIIMESGPFGDNRHQQFGWPLQNVWLGTSIENQKAADERLEHLVRAQAATRFISAEPLLGPVNLGLLGTVPYTWNTGRYAAIYDYIDQVIVGGESGAGARRMDLAWARALKEECELGGVKYHFKQLGSVLARELGTAHPKGEDPDDPRFPADLRVREEPAHPNVHSRPLVPA